VGAPATVTRFVAGIDSIQVQGARVRALRIVERSAASPVPVTMWFDEAGRLLRSQYASPFGLTETALTDSATAMRANEGGALSEEQYARTLVKTTIKIPQARRVEAMRLALSVEDSAFAWPDLNGPGQRVLSKQPRQVVLEVTRRHAPAGHHRFPVASTAA